MARTKKDPKSPKVSKNSVLNDDALGVDIKSDEVEVIAADIDINNKNVSDVVVIKNAANDKDAFQVQTTTFDETVADPKDELLTKKDSLKDGSFDKKDKVLNEVSNLHQTAKSQADDYQKTHNTKGVSGKLGLLGAYIGSLYVQKTSHQAVDLTADFDDDIFHRQGGQIINQLLGSKGATAQKLAKKFVPDEKLTGISDIIYNKIADWANAWAVKDLQNDARFVNLDSLSDVDKKAFANDIANQNRALATLGGVTGFMGLKGVVVDTAWLLLISLKSVYQLAIVSGKPLTGKDGVMLAYGILSKCNLDKLQEKQVIMTALALGNTVLVNAQSTSLTDELKKVAQTYQNRSYTAGFDELSKYIDLDKLNPKWLHWLMPIGSTALSAYYNAKLIDEVLGVAQATFEDVPLIRNDA